MLKKISILLLLLTIQFSYSQKKKRIYLNDDDIEITKDNLQSADKRKFYIETIKTDTSITKKLVSKRAFGFLDSIYKNQIINTLKKITGKNINIKTKLYLHYYDDDNKNLKRSKKNIRYWNYIQNIPEKITSFLLVSEKTKLEETSDINAFKDKNDILKKLFFSNSKFKVNHVVISPNGEFVIYYGDSDILYILDSEI